MLFFKGLRIDGCDRAMENMGSSPDARIHSARGAGSELEESPYSTQLRLSGTALFRISTKAHTIFHMHTSVPKM